MLEAFPWIAVVDDDPSVRNALRRTLRVRGFQTKTYGSAQEFLAGLAHGLPQCLILDLQMPQMSGLDLLHHLKHQEIQIPTIIITAHSEVELRERCESAGAVGFLLKPLQDASLFATIADASAAALSRGHRPPQT